MCPHFHLSLQSGCDTTLKRMNRHYTAEDYKVVVENLRRYMPDVSITTDIIVGFPGESEKEFNETYDFLSGIKLSKMHIFKYSPRTGTKAAEMDFQVDGNIKEQRSNKLIELNSKNEKEFMEKFLNREMDVLYEEEVKGREKYYIGYTPNYIKVITHSEEDLKGRILSTKLMSAESENMIGEI
ncbi:Threonylcarbamoyladenosine tRNA methylthiotransferase MtaB [bioreactor metagenome]|uniref:Threonylcarbamoyladenosine tRNA methylthiotransferase MtaB n=1 Tax=bioreactor metagenome TaxID=1076179 RepID=A0A645DBI6_9ZZZZ